LECSFVTDKVHTSELQLSRKELAGEGALPTPQIDMSANPILAKYRYRRRLPHLQKADSDLFITFCTSGRKVLPPPARDLVMEHCLREAGILRFGVARAPSPAMAPKPRIHLHAVVVMPDHVHLLLTPLRHENGWPFPLRLPHPSRVICERVGILILG
jgi:hypothetical protein